MSARWVLVVEDNPVNMLLMREVLRLDGHEIEEATTVPEAWARLEQSLPAVVLLDVQIPGGGGEALLARVRGDARMAGLPVVAVTAQAMAGDRERLLALGFDDYVGKPIDMGRLRVVVGTYVGRRP